MKPVYKKVKVYKEHCPICGQQLLGNNSMANPWHCECGEWVYKHNWDEKGGYNFEYEIKKRLIIK